MNESNYEVLVIGAGIAGTSAACELATDARVVLLDMESRPGYHATGRSAAYFAPSYGNATVRNLTKASETFYTSPPAGFSETPLVIPRSALFIAREDQRGSLDVMHDENPSLNRIDAAGMTSLVPIIRPNVVSLGLLDTIGGDLDVDAIMQGYLRLFRRRGGELMTDQCVRHIRYHRGQWVVTTATSELRARFVVNAAGAWADGIASLAGTPPLGLVPKRRTVVLIDPPADIDINNWPLVIDIDEKFYFKPDAGQILLSPADETPSDPCDAQAEDWDVAVAIDRLTQVANIVVRRVNHRWAGLRTFTPDKTFLVGFDPRARGFFWLAGQGGYGVQSAPAMSQLARHLLLGSALPDGYQAVTDEITAVSPERLLR